MSFLIWDRDDFAGESTAMDMDSDEEMGFCWFDGGWKAEAFGNQILGKFGTLRDAEAAVEFAIEHEELTHGRRP